MAVLRADISWRHAGTLTPETRQGERPEEMPVTIENPILNSPFVVPERHWRIADEGITDEPIDGRRRSAYFIPVPPPRKKGGQLSLDGSGWTAEQQQSRLGCQ